MGLEPLVETPANITVIRFTHDGIDVKSILVPLVDATAVPETNGLNVPIESATVPAKVAFCEVLKVNAVVGVAPVCKTSAPVVSAVTLYAVELVVDALIVLI